MNASDKDTLPSIAGLLSREELRPLGVAVLLSWLATLKGVPADLMWQDAAARKAKGLVVDMADALEVVAAATLKELDHTCVTDVAALAVVLTNHRAIQEALQKAARRDDRSGEAVARATATLHQVSPAWCIEVLGVPLCRNLADGAAELLPSQCVAGMLTYACCGCKEVGRSTHCISLVWRRGHGRVQSDQVLPAF